jgi:hypothetical protein
MSRWSGMSGRERVRWNPEMCQVLGNIVWKKMSVGECQVENTCQVERILIVCRKNIQSTERMSGRANVR